MNLQFDFLRFTVIKIESLEVSKRQERGRRSEESIQTYAIFGFFSTRTVFLILVRTLIDLEIKLMLYFLKVSFLINKTSCNSPRSTLLIKPLSRVTRKMRDTTSGFVSTFFLV